MLGVFNVHAVLNEKERREAGVRGRYAALLCDAWDERLGFPELLEKARKQHKVKWGSPGRKSDIVLIEEKSSGKSMRQTMAKWGIPTWPYNPGNQSKTMRAHAVAPIVKQSMLWVPESSVPDRTGMPRDWCDGFMDQVCAYAGPGTTEHDDYVDALTSALLYLRDRNMLEATPADDVVDYEEKRMKDIEDAEKEYDRTKSREAVNPYGI